MRRAKLAGVLAVFGLWGWAFDPGGMWAAMNPLPGVWRIDDAVGANQRKWDALMELRQLPDGRYVGKFHWKADDGSETGEETFDGQVAEMTLKGKPTEVLVLQGRKSTSAAGTLMQAKYGALIADDGTRLNGVWTETPDAPGRWQARWVRQGELVSGEYP
jgi:hypothetical protein